MEWKDEDNRTELMDTVRMLKPLSVWRPCRVLYQRGPTARLTPNPRVELVRRRVAPRCRRSISIP